MPIIIDLKIFKRFIPKKNKTVINIGDVVFEESRSTANVRYNVRSICVTEGELTASQKVSV